MVHNGVVDGRVDGRMIIIQNNTSKVEYAYLVVVVECVHMGGGACQYLPCTQR